jgi:hypothetical protein
MFAGVIDKSQGLPWGDVEIDWMAIAPRAVRISALTATQLGVHFAPLLPEFTRPGHLDEFPRVIVIPGEAAYLEDGHHRVVRKMLEGKLYVWARVATL